jgi:hypothetical protein
MKNFRIYQKSDKYRKKKEIQIKIEFYQLLFKIIKLVTMTFK